MARVVIIDTETTGNKGPDNQVIQLAAKESLIFWTEELAKLNPKPIVLSCYFRNTVPIDPEAMAVHHILPYDVNLCPTYEEADERYKLPPDVDYVVGHNVDFDADALKLPPTVKRICTFAMARKVWPKLPRKLVALVYALTIEKYKTESPAENTTTLDPLTEALARVREKATKAHSADVDVDLCSMVLDRLFSAYPPLFGSPEILYQFSEACRIPERMSFGKHGPRPECPEGDRISDLPDSYINWLLRNIPDLDPYLKKTLEDELYGRAAPTLSAEELVKKILRESGIVEKTIREAESTADEPLF